MARSQAALPVALPVPRRARLVAGLRRYSRSPVGLVGVVLIVLVVITAVFAPLIAPHNPRDTDLFNVLKGPSRAHLLGTDEIGRDILTRIIYGTRPALMVGVTSVMVAILIGLPLGMVAGYFRGKADAVIGRVLDAFLSFPTLILALAMAAVFGSGLVTTIAAIAFVYWPPMARLVRGQTLTLRERDWVSAAGALGAGAPRILFQHIAPNLMAVVIVVTSVNLGSAILIEAALSFLGLGVPPPAPSWGLMLRSGYPSLETSPWPALAPGMAIFLTVLGFNFLGDGLRDFLDPRLRQ